MPIQLFLLSGPPSLCTQNSYWRACVTSTDFILGGCGCIGWDVQLGWGVCRGWHVRLFAETKEVWDGKEGGFHLQRLGVSLSLTYTY